MPLKSLELSRRASEMETENAEMRLAINGMEPDAADRETKMNEYNAGLQSQLDVMKERDAALDEEDKAAQLAMATNADTSGMTPQLREFHHLGQRTSIVNYMQATVSEKRVSGAEAEYNDEVFGGNWQQGDYPTEMLLERSEYGGLAANAIADMQGEEKRTLITGVVAGSENESYVARLLGRRRRRVPWGLLPLRRPRQAQLPDCVWQHRSGYHRARHRRSPCRRHLDSERRSRPGTAFLRDQLRRRASDAGPHALHAKRLAGVSHLRPGREGTH